MCVCFVYVTTVIGKKRPWIWGVYVVNTLSRLKEDMTRFICLFNACVFVGEYYYELHYPFLFSNLFFTQLFSNSLLDTASWRITEISLLESHWNGMLRMLKKKSQAKLQHLFVNVWNIILIENVIFELWIRRTIHEL